MRSRSTLVARVRRELPALADAGLDLESLVAEAGQIVRRAVPYDGACWHELDPGTLIETSSYLENMPATNSRASEIEYLRDDFNKFASLARSERPTAVLSVTTGGRPIRSLRYRRIVRPFGFEGELRAAFVADGSCWGSFGLFRAAPSDFTQKEADVIAEIAVDLGRAFRAALFGVAGTREAVPGAPGLVLLGADRRVQAQTPAAGAWLQQLGWKGDPRTDDLPYALYTVADTARRSRGDAAARVRTRSGDWVVLHASIAAGAGPGEVAVILEGSKPSAIVPLIARAYGLSKREREVTQLVLQGIATNEIAERLVISPHTVQQHLKLIFEKVGVHSRRELIGRIFVGYDRPAIEDADGG